LTWKLKWLTGRKRKQRERLSEKTLKKLSDAIVRSHTNNKYER